MEKSTMRCRCIAWGGKANWQVGKALLDFRISVAIHVPSCAALDMNAEQDICSLFGSHTLDPCSSDEQHVPWPCAAPFMAMNAE
jgi:hypothetical protein